MREPPKKQRSENIVQKGMPANLDAERIVLGIAMRDAGAVEDITQILSTEDFSLEKHRKIFLAVKEIGESGMPVSPVIIANTLVGRSQLEAVDGLTYLMDLQNAAAAVEILSSYRSYIDIVKEKALRREIIFMAQKMANEAFTSELTNSEIIQTAEVQIENMRGGVAKPGSSSKSLKEFIDEQTPAKLMDVTNRQRGLVTGLSKFDELTNGFFPGDIFLLGARPGVGKTAAALNLAERVAARNPGWVAFFTLEMFKDALFDRMLARASGLDFRNLARDGMTEEDRKKIVDAMTELYEKRIIIDDEAGLSMGDIYNRIRAIQRDKPVCMAVIDYIQLVKPNDRKRAYPNENAMLTDISNELQWATKKLRIPFLVLSQLRRPEEKSKNKRPTLEDFRGSGTIEQVAWRGFLLHRTAKPDDPSTKEDLEGILDKNRMGPIGDIKMRLGGARSTLSEVED